MTFPILRNKEPESQDLCRQEKTVYLKSIFKITTNESNNNLIVRVTWILRYLSVIVCVADNCTEYDLQFEKVFSVPGDVAMLNSTLLTSSVFNFSAVPYNITWYDPATAKEMTNQTSRILVRGETLWFLNVTKEDAGKYLTTVRYVGAESEVKLMCWSSHFCSSGHKTPFSPPHFHQNTNMVLQTGHRAGGGPTICGMWKAEKSWPAPYKQSSWCTFLPSEWLCHQTEELQRRLLHHVVQSEWWETLIRSQP